MERDTIIFAGQSNTFGLGLEWELDSELNSEEYLNKGVHLPLDVNTRDNYEKKYWKYYRWSSLTCKDLNYNEFNVHDSSNKPTVGGTAPSAIWHLYEKKDDVEIKKLIDRIKYVVLEIGYVRWWDENLHGKEGGEYLPNTPTEIENYLKLKNSNPDVVEAAIEWIKNYNEENFWIETYKKIMLFQKEFPEIKVILVPWSGNQPDFLNKNELYDKIKDSFINIPNWEGGIMGYLQNNKLQIWNVAKAWNGNYKYNYKEDHASVKGHRWVADRVIDHIKKLEKTNLI
jgi:hypothetical protein